MVPRIFKIVCVFHTILLGATLLVSSVLLLPECVFPYMIMGGLGTALGQQGQQSGKRPKRGVEENEDKLEPSKYFYVCPSLHFPAETFRSNDHHFPLLSESYASSSFNCSNSELYWEGGDGKHTSQINQLVNRTSARLLKEYFLDRYGLETMS